MLTYQFRIKDATTCKKLCKMAGSVNYLWNYLNQTSYEAIKKNNEFLSAFDLCKLTAGCSKDLGLQGHSIQIVCGEYATRRKQFKKIKLNWRSKKRNLGWIPFDSEGIRIKDGKATYLKQTFRFWKSREIKGTIKTGSFSQDSRGRWYINLQCEVESMSQVGTQELGLDLGLKTQATLSDGREFGRQNLTRHYEQKLAMAQRAKKKKRVTALHAKIANKRKDWNHKTANEILKDCKALYIGNVSSTKLVKTRLAKSVLDAGWGQLRAFLDYKSKKLGMLVKDTNEKFSTVTCSVCGTRSGPSGLSGLGVRRWSCGSCGTEHDRDVNAARNILNAGLGHQTPIKGIPRL